MTSTLYQGASRSSHLAQAQARQRIGVLGVSAFIVSAAAPLTVIAGSAATAYAVTGFIGVPVAYAATGLILAVFVNGFVAMARYIGQAGGLYVYVTHGLGRTPGIAAAFVALYGYNILQISIYGAAGVVANLVAEALLGASAPWWLWALGIWLLIAVAGQRSLVFNKRLLAGLLLLEFAVIVTVTLVLLMHPAGATVTATALNPVLLLHPAAAAILVGGVAGYAGFEGGPIFSEHVKDRKRTIARATFLALALITVVYALSSWAMTVAAGPGNLVAAAQTHGTDLYFALAQPYLPSWVLDAGRMLLLTSLIAALLAFHHMLARIKFSLGREGILPSAFGRTGQRTAAPVLGSAAQSTVAFTTIVTFAVLGLDPVRHLFFAAGITGGLGILTLMAATSVAVIVFFARHHTMEPLWRRAAAPAIAAVLLTGLLVATVYGFGDLIGSPKNSPARWILPATYPGVCLAGIWWAQILRRRNPTVYAALREPHAAGTATSRPSHSVTG